MKVRFVNKGAILKGEIFYPRYFKGRAIILLHGFTSSRKFFSSLITPLLNLNFLVMVYDQRAHGLSSGTFDLNLMVDDLLKAIDILRKKHGVDRLSLVGHSMGGYIATLASAKRDVDLLISWAAPLNLREAVIEKFKIAEIIAQLPSVWLEYLGFEFRFGKLKVDHFGVFLKKLLNESQMNAVQILPKVRCKKYIHIYGKRDKSVPYYHTKLLYKLAPPPRKLILVNCGHGSEKDKRKVFSILEKIFKRNLNR